MRPASTGQTVLDSRSEIRPDAVDAYFAVLRPIVDGIAQTFGSKCEAVLHDFRDPERSIIAIAGDVTHRHTGGSVTQIGISLLAQGDEAEDQLNYITRTSDGRVLKSTTILLRDPNGHVFGALCINFDVTDLRLVARTLGDLAGSLKTLPDPVTFVDDIGQVIQSVIDEEEARHGLPTDRMTKQERLIVIQALDERGVFALQRSVPQVAEYLGISRATAYSYLEEIRSARASENGSHRPARG